MVNDITNKKTEMKASGKPKKEKNQGPPTKIVIRKLPPTYTEEEFKSAISSVPENSYFKFVPADKSFGPHAFSRAYINFVNADEIYSFRDRFDGYVFVDQKGNEYPALVEYAPFQKIPKPSHQKKDIRCGTIDEDPDYVAFLDLLQNPEAVNLPQIETLLEEIDNIEKETRASNGYIKVKTPLLEYIEQRSADRYRLGDKKRRKEYDRKKAREEEKRKRKEIIKEYRKREDLYAREDRERDRAKKREEERLKWKEKKQEKERHMKRDKSERYKADDRPSKGKDYFSDPKNRLEEAEDEKGSLKITSSFSFKEEKQKGSGLPPQKTKRYSEVRKKEEREKRYKEERNRAAPTSEGKKDEGKLEEASSQNNNEEKEDPLKAREEKSESTSKTSSLKDAEKGLALQGREEEQDQLNQLEDFPSSKDTRERTEETEDKSGSKDPRTERRIRNKDRPAMQLYRPGQSRLKAVRPRNNENGGATERAVDGAESSSSSASPVMGVTGGSEGNEPQPVPPPPQQELCGGGKKEGGGGKSYLGGRGYERKTAHAPHKYRDTRGGGSHCWEGERDGGGGGREGGGSKSGGTRKGYSYHHERESKGKWSTRSQKEQEALSGSQFKSLTFRRSTSQE